MIYLILIIGFVLRLINLNQSLWLDETVQAITSQGSFSNIFFELSGDFHPPLYHVIMWFWVHLFGSGEIILRLPSVLFGVGTIYIVYLLAREISRDNFKFKIVNFKFAEIAALFLMVAPFHVYYSQEARPYALVAFLVSLSMYFFLKKKWFFYIVATTLALYSSYFVFFILLVQGLVLLSEKKPKLLLPCCLVVLLFLPWLPMFIKQIEVGRQAVAILPQWGVLVSASFIKALPLTFIKFIIGRVTIFDKTIYGISAFFLFLVYGFILLKGFLKKNLLINLWLIIPVFLALLLSINIPNFQPFRLLFVLSAFYLLLVSGLSSFKNSKVAGLFIGFILLVSSISLFQYYLNPYFWREDWRGVVNYIESQQKAVAILPSSTSDWPWRYYSNDKVQLFVGGQGAMKVDQKTIDNNLIMKQFNNKTIYYIRYLQPLFDPQEKILSKLQEESYTKTREISFNQIPVWEFNYLK